MKKLYKTMLSHIDSLEGKFGRVIRQVSFYVPYTSYPSCQYDSHSIEDIEPYRGVVKMGDPQVTIRFNTKLSAFWMICGFPILEHLHIEILILPARQIVMLIIYGCHVDHLRFRR